MTGLPKELALIKHSDQRDQYWSYFRAADAIYVMGGKFPNIETCEPLSGGLSSKTVEQVYKLVAEKRADGFIELTDAEMRKCLAFQFAQMGIESLTTFDLDVADIEDDDLSDLGPELVISYAIDECVADAVYAKRNAAMELVEAALERSELGAWAACESGMGTVDVIFEVADADRAKALAIETLRDTKFADYARLEIVTY